MKCPNCGVACAESALECGACGLLFSKWRERQEREEREAAAALAKLEVKPDPPLDSRVARSFALGAAVIWCALFAWYVHLETLRARDRAAASSEEGGDLVQVRDPETGDIKTIRIVYTPSR